jgi:hypothetical protein
MNLLHGIINDIIKSCLRYCRMSVLSEMFMKLLHGIICYSLHIDIVSVYNMFG